MAHIDVHALAASALDALHRGDVGKARESFQQVVDQGQPDAGSLLALADACRRLGDSAAAMSAVDKALASNRAMCVRWCKRPTF